jgi:hypothetical protein
MKTQTFAKSGHELNSSSQGFVIIPSQRPKIPNGRKQQELILAM